MSLKLYCDLLSQPSRAVFLFLKATNIPFQAVPVLMQNSEHLKDQYIQNVSKSQSVPVLCDNGFKVFDSVAILRYLVRQHQIADHWYPINSQKQAQVDEYLEWQHHNMGFLVDFYIQRKGLSPISPGEPTRPELIEESENRMVFCLEKMEGSWLTGGKQFVAGNDVTIADLCAVCDLEQLTLAKYNLDGYPRIMSWMSRVRHLLMPHYDEVHSLVHEFAERNKGNSVRF